MEYRLFFLLILHLLPQVEKLDIGGQSLPHLKLQ